ncbi:TetR/AcrR family transcriptional regulator [Salipaludibacillus agaradhaerens]|uniref:TetR/AcrR family transcriptional regulator n=1 Tax=Salipaludibacillus agaradhaerens TaxID=76935 RepID=UPI002150EE4E|nr:TetR/AcrR family transcriptional regulator [Salipaludibacillus agaradhaerens]MCR6119521.1 TetR/AcrR family transcriptional regulator [Salipaludibacillus agaradhaerens]
MYTKFYSLPLEKQERIINAAINEFVKNGYDKASTNDIVRGAEISKGSLFNYFNNKKDLYLFLLEYATGIVDDIYQGIDFNETDIFKRIGQIGRVKLNIQRKFPQVFNFWFSVVNEESAEVKAEIEEKQDNILKEGFERIYENIDFSKFRQGIDIEKAINILNWTMVGFSEKLKNDISSIEEVSDEALKEWDSYSELLKHSFYR